MTRNEIKKKIKECLQKFDGVDSPDDMVSETLFNIYGQEMNEICRLFESEFHKLSQDAVSRRFFTDVEDFNQFMINEKPKEIWFDEFMEDEPYIILSFNDGVKFRGVYNHKILLGGDNSDFTWLYKSGMYVKVFC